MSLTSFTLSALKFPLTATSFGARQVRRLLTGSAETVGAQCYRAASVAQEQFETNSPLFAAYQLGDLSQQALIDFAFDALTLRVLHPSYIGSTLSTATKASASAWASLSTQDARDLAVQQIQNNFTVVNLVNQVNAPTVLSADGTYPLERCVDDAYALGDYAAIWAIEGLGENYADAYLSSAGGVDGLLTTGKGGQLPDKPLLMLHAGMGIAFAKHIVRKLNPWSSPEQFCSALTRFIDLVNRNARPGYEGPALESLGLVTRTWHNQLTEPLTQQLMALNPLAAEYFWHGAGRAMYFTPIHFIPGFSPFFAADQEPPDEIGRLNARAGAAWAFTLVNIRQPQIAALFLKTRNKEIAGNDAYSNGLLSTFIMAGDLVPGDPYVAEFCAYQPDPNDPTLVGLWEQNVGVDGARRVSEYRRILRASNRLGEVFRYHPLGSFVAGLDSGSRRG